MSEEDLKRLIAELNERGELPKLEAKLGSDVGRAVQESISSFSNEPGLGGGTILLGVEEIESGEGFDFRVVGVDDPEKVMNDLASQCATLFNRVLRPRMDVVSTQSGSVVAVAVPEAPVADKPIYIRKLGLPQGAFRRIGASDQQCTEDDLLAFLREWPAGSYDSHVLPDASIEDIDAGALTEYRRIRADASPSAEELLLDDHELLLALGCAKWVDGTLRPTVAGMLLFGTQLGLRKHFPMTRIDYIRVSGQEWVEDPSERYATVEIRAPVIAAIRGAEAAIVDDLPKGFLLPEGELQRSDKLPIPRRVLREAIVNAVMHRNYRVHSAVQLVRYANRLEIINAGYSLKPPDRLSEPGSTARNPVIAAVLHDARLAETKGTGIRVMRKLMEESELAPPTFESDRGRDTFTARLLMHHFLSADDLAWLSSLPGSPFDKDEKMALVFLREVGAIDNSTYRDIAGVEGHRATSRLRRLTDLDLIVMKGQARGAYYVASTRFLQSLQEPSAESDKVPAESDMVAAESAADSADPPKESPEELFEALPQPLQQRVAQVGRYQQKQDLIDLIADLCAWRPLDAEQIAGPIGRNRRYVVQNYLSEMVSAGRLSLLHPDMPRHPDQAYGTNDS